MAKIFFVSLLYTTMISAQEWKYYNTSTSGLPSNLVYAIVIAPDSTIWIGTGSGIASFKTNVWTIYDTTNSPLPDPYITCLAVDSSNTLWIGTGYAGVARLKDGVWTLYDTANSDIPHNTLFDITIGPDQSPWFATEDGVVNYKNNIWKNYKNDLIEPQSRSVAFDVKGTLWMGTYTPVDFRGYIEYMKDEIFTHTVLSKLEIFSTFARRILAINDSTVFVATGNGLIKFENEKWTVFRMQDSPLPANGVSSLARIGDTIIVGTASGIVEIVNNTWKVFHPAPGNLPNDVVYAIAVDRSGNRWCATGSSGIVVYKKGGIVTATQRDEQIPRDFELFQNHPNPFNPSTMISFQLQHTAHTSLIVFDAIGRKVSTIVNEVKEAGIYSVSFNASGLSSGVYVACLQSGDKRQYKKMVLIK